MSSKDKTPTSENVLLRVRNGDVIRFDDTGLILKLSDQVVADLQERLSPALDAELLGDVDAWNLLRTGDWYKFDANLPGADGARCYRRAVAGGDCFADAPGAVLGLLSLGGSRRARSQSGQSPFPYHIVSAADDIGAVGVAGIEQAVKTEKVETVKSLTQDTLLAQEILSLRKAKNSALPLIYTRCETDESASINALADGKAMENLLIAADNLKAFASTLDKRAKITAVSLDFNAEDVLSDPNAFLKDLLSMVAKIGNALWQRDFATPYFLTVFDTSVPDRCAVMAKLATLGSDSKITITMPDYVLEYDDHMRLTDAAMQLRAKTEAAAVAELEAGHEWRCPSLMLAEWDGSQIRVKSNALSDLQLEDQNGFTLTAEGQPVEIENVEIDPNEPRDLLITPQTGSSEKPVTVRYGLTSAGSLHDSWTHPSDPTIHRWALPTTLEVQKQCSS